MPAQRFLRPAQSGSGVKPVSDVDGARTEPSRAGLPKALAQRLPRHLAWAAVIYGGLYLTNIASHWIFVLFDPDFVVGNAPRIEIIAPLFVVLSLFVFLVARRGKLALGWLIYLGLGFEILGALGIAIGSITPHFPEATAGYFMGIPWTAVWVVAFPLMVPGRPVHAAIAGVLSSLAVVAGLQINIWLEGASPAPFGIWVGLLFANLLCAAWGTIGSAAIYRLGREASSTRQLGSYHLQELLGRGGMGEVWRGEHRLLARPAAIKLISLETLGDDVDIDMEVTIKRFEREAQATASLQSPHSVSLFDYGVADDGTFFHVFELLDGVNLETLVKEHGPVEPARVIHWLEQACLSLAEAHHLGLVHRDIKPANLFVCRYGLQLDFLKVLDFGLVKLLESQASDPQLTGAQAPPGTPAYMPPEVALGGREIDGRADLYALGCVAYWLLTGKLVFERSSPIDMVMGHIEDPVVPPSVCSEIEIPADLEAIVLACLEKDPEDRPASALEVAERLGQCRDAGRWDPKRAQQWWQERYPEIVDGR